MQDGKFKCEAGWSQRLLITKPSLFLSASILSHYIAWAVRHVSHNLSRLSLPVRVQSSKNFGVKLDTAVNCAQTRSLRLSTRQQRSQTQRRSPDSSRDRYSLRMAELPARYHPEGHHHLRTTLRKGNKRESKSRLNPFNWIEQGIAHLIVTNMTR